MIGKIKKNIRNYYDNKIAYSKFGDWFYLLENRDKTNPVNENFTKYSASGDTSNISFLIGTQSQGLLLYNNGEITMLFKENGFYGITKLSDTFYAFHKTGMHGNIISFRIEKNKAIDINTVIKGLSRGIHQIDFIGQDLYVTNTYDNSILIYSKLVSKHNLHWKDYNKIIYPNGKLQNGRKSSNYNHFNSLFKYKNKIFLIAHNETKKTNRSSEIFTLNDITLKTLDIKKIDGSNCHNIYIDNENKMFCKSHEGTLNINEQDVISHKNIFTRGLSVNDEYIILGGSDIQPNRLKREKTNGYIYIYDSQLSLKQTILIRNTQIQEIYMEISEKKMSNFSNN
jgi:hypothetical protein